MATEEDAREIGKKRDGPQGEGGPFFYPVLQWSSFNRVEKLTPKNVNYRPAIGRLLVRLIENDIKGLT